MRLHLCFPLLLALPVPAFAQKQDPQSITVKGKCLRKISQDRGAVTVTSQFIADTPKKASETAISRHEKAKAEIKALNLKDMLIETSGFSVTQYREQVKDKWIMKGYRAGG